MTFASSFKMISQEYNFLAMNQKRILRDVSKKYRTVSKFQVKTGINL